MADHAASDDGSPESIVDLVNDDRWQARLEEARARREVALREKGKNPEAAPKRKPMPWEKDLAERAKSDFDPIIQAPDTDGFDFADRVDKVRDTAAQDETSVDPKGAPVPAQAATPAPPASFEDMMVEGAFEEDLEEEWVPPPKKAHSAISESAPDVIELASRYASTLSPSADSHGDVTDVFDEDEAPAVTAMAVPKEKIHPPAILLLGIVFLAALPFTFEVPPLDRGPAMPTEPSSLRLKPALGFTTAMLWEPARTSSGDWTPAETWAMPLATVLSPKTPNIVTRPVTLSAPSAEQAAVAVATPEAVTGSPRSAQPPTLDGASVDRLPGAFSRRPAARPPVGEPVSSTRAPSRLPDVATGNDASPKIAPNTDPDSSLLDQVSALTTVMFDRAPQIGDRALDALKRSEAAAILLGPETVLQLTVLVPSQGDVKVANQFAKDAAARGHTIDSVKTVNVSISTRNLRYFFDSDRGEAERLAKAYDATARDFTWFKPKPSAGTVELWLEGSAPAPRAPRVVRAAPQPVAPAPAPVVVERKPEGFLSRLFGGHRVGATRSAGVDGASDNTRVVVRTDRNTGTNTPVFPVPVPVPVSVPVSVPVPVPPVVVPVPVSVPAPVSVPVPVSVPPVVSPPPDVSVSVPPDDTDTSGGTGTTGGGATSGGTDPDSSGGSTDSGSTESGSGGSGNSGSSNGNAGSSNGSSGGSGGDGSDSSDP